jgi:hypothetical protein
MLWLLKRSRSSSNSKKCSPRQHQGRSCLQPLLLLLLLPLLQQHPLLLLQLREM